LYRNAYCFSKNFAGVIPPDPVQKGRGRRSKKEREKRKRLGERARGKGRRAGKRKCREGWEGRCVPPLFLKPIAAPAHVQFDWIVLMQHDEMCSNQRYYGAFAWT
jgi:hypothetical protein